MSTRLLFESMSLASKMTHKEPISAEDYLLLVKEIDTQMKMLDYKMAQLKNVAENLKGYPIKESEDGTGSP